MYEYNRMNRSGILCRLGELDSSMSVDDLVTLIARSTSLCASQIERRLLDTVNEMLRYEVKEGDKK